MGVPHLETITSSIWMKETTHKIHIKIHIIAIECVCVCVLY